MRRKSAFVGTALVFGFFLFGMCAYRSAVITASEKRRRQAFVEASLSGVLLTEGNVLQHVLGGAHGHGGPLVDALGLDVQDGLEAGGGHAARLLHDEGHGVALVQQAQL